MKINHRTFWVCIGLMIFCAGLYILCVREPVIETIKELLLGIATGAFVSVIIALVNYFHEREMLIAKAASLSLSAYYNLSVLEGLVRHILLQLGCSSAPLQDIPFQNASSIARMNSEAYNGVSEELYAPFLKEGVMFRNYVAFASYRSVFQNMALIAQSIESLALQMNAALMQMQQAQQIGTLPPDPVAPLIDKQDKLLLVKVAKFHEHVTDRKMSYETIARYFYSRAHKGDTWEKMVAKISSEVDEIIANYTAQNPCCQVQKNGWAH